MRNDSITGPKGFPAGVAAGVKVSGKPDLGLPVYPTGATAQEVLEWVREQIRE